MEVCPYCHFRWCGYFGGPWLSFVMTDKFSVRSQKLIQGLVSHDFTAQLSNLKLFYLNELWTYYQTDANQVTLHCASL